MISQSKPTALPLFERIYAPLTAGLLKPFAGDRNLAPDKRCQLDHLYQPLTDDLDALYPQSDSRLLLKQYNENKILVSRCTID